MRAEQFDDAMTSWLESRAGGGDVDAVIQSTLDRTRHIRPAPRWRLPGSWLPEALLAAIPRPAAAGPVLVVLMLLLALALVVVAMGSQPRPAPPLGLAAPGRVVYVADADLWSANADGSDAHRITDDDRIEGFPAHSPDGTMIAFKRLPDEGATTDWQSLGDIVVARSDGSDPRIVDQLVMSPSPISWSTDSQHIVYSRAVDGVDQVFVAEVAPDAPITVQQVTDDALFSWGPSFSPDATSAAFVRGYPEIDGIWVVRLDTGAERRLTDVPFAELDEIAWSPDGRTLLFTAGETGDHSIWTVPSGGGNLLEVANEIGGLSGAAWSPTGSRIAYLHQIGQGTVVWVMSAGGSHSVAIGPAANGMTPRWSPDEESILVVDARSLTGPPALALLDPEGVRPPESFEIPDYQGDRNGRVDAPSWQRLAP
jgi:Tol biopolymer transport system component